MNFITFTDAGIFNASVNALALEATAEIYEVDEDSLTIHAEDVYEIVGLLHDAGITEFDVVRNDSDSEPSDDMDGDHASALASAGFGEDEAYGCYGGSDE